MEMHLSTAHCPQTGGQTERVNLILQEVLRACILDFGRSWGDHLHHVEFVCNNSNQSSIGMT